MRLRNDCLIGWSFKLKFSPMLFYIYMIHHKDWFKNVDAILFFSVKSRLLFKKKKKQYSG